MNCALLTQLQNDAIQAYAALGHAVELSAGSAHERVRKLRERGVIRRTTVEVDPDAVGRGVLPFVMLDGTAWMGGTTTRDSLAAISEIEEAHIIAGSAALLVKVRTGATKALQAVLRRIFDIDGSPELRPSSSWRWPSNALSTSTMMSSNQRHHLP